MPSPEQALRRLAENRRFPDLALSMRRRGGPVEHYAVGAVDQDTPYFAASVGKLFTLTIILQLTAEGRLQLDDPFMLHLSAPLMNRISLINGRDCTDSITIRQLLSHTSGLPDYFQSSNARDGLYAELIRGSDRRWSLEDVVAITRRLGPVAAPGRARRAHYSDTNYQILGRLIEVVEGVAFSQSVQTRICSPLGLQSTAIATIDQPLRSLPLRYRDTPLHLPLAQSCFGADGGLVTTSRDCLAFTEAFMRAELFPSSLLAQTAAWRPLFWPVDYGLGVMRFRLPAVLSGLTARAPLIGHSGLSGAFAFAAADGSVTFSGTVNQITRPETAFRLMLSLQ
jgi:CubicO group peptidase (beta-lactamase class C family)